jgi:hypothetical protein
MAPVSSYFGEFALADLIAQALEVAEKVAFIVIPSEARDLLLRKAQEKSRFLGQTPPSE